MGGRAAATSHEYSKRVRPTSSEVMATLAGDAAPLCRALRGNRSTKGSPLNVATLGCSVVFVGCTNVMSKLTRATPFVCAMAFVEGAVVTGEVAEQPVYTCTLVVAPPQYFCSDVLVP